MSINRDLYLQQKGITSSVAEEYPGIGQITSLRDKIIDAIKFYLNKEVNIDKGDLLAKLSQISMSEYNKCYAILFSMKKGEDNTYKMKQVINIINK